MLRTVKMIKLKMIEVILNNLQPSTLCDALQDLKSISDNEDNQNEKKNYSVDVHSLFEVLSSLQINIQQ